MTKNSSNLLRVTRRVNAFEVGFRFNLLIDDHCCHIRDAHKTWHPRVIKPVDTLRDPSQYSSSSFGNKTVEIVVETVLMNTLT